MNSIIFNVCLKYFHKNEIPSLHGGSDKPILIKNLTKINFFHSAKVSFVARNVSKLSKIVFYEAYDHTNDSVDAATSFKHT